MRDVATQATEVFSEGHLSSKGFTIKANAKAFRILIYGLYADKPRAIVREISANALDSHVAAGCPEVPFDCHLPNRMEPFFSIRDYGTSLTHEQMEHIYTTVFESTKEDTNDQVGKFGLGSKTPFAYTEAFTVTAYLDGEMRLYNAFINSRGEPTLALLSREATTEKNGIEVSFPVSPEDYNSFLEAARFTFLGFDVKPNITGNAIEFPEPSMEGNGWRTLRSDAYNQSGLMIRQGCVIYPLDISPVVNHDSCLTLANQMFRDLSSLSLIVDMPIGTVDITPSRESLSYDNSTIENIISRFEVVWEELFAPFIEPIQGKTPWEAYLNGKAASERIENTFTYNVSRGLRSRLEWRGENWPIRRVVDLGENPKIPSIKVYDLRNKTRRFAGSNPMGFNSGTRLNRLSMDTVASSTVCFVKSSELPEIPRLSARIKEYLTNNQSKLIVVQYDTERDLKRLIVMLGRPNISPENRLGDLPLPPKKPRGPISKPVGIPAEVHGINGFEGILEVDIKNGGLYIVTERDNWFSRNNPDSPSFISQGCAVNYFTALVRCGILDSTSKLYVIGKTFQKNIASNGLWVPFYTFANSATAKLLSPSEVDFLRKEKLHRDTYQKYGKPFRGALQEDFDFEPNKPAYNILREIMENGGFDEDLDCSVSLSSLALADASGLFPKETSKEETVSENNWKKLTKEFSRAYPLLERCWTHHKSPDFWKEASDYIKMIDKTT